MTSKAFNPFAAAFHGPLQMVRRPVAAALLFLASALLATLLAGAVFTVYGASGLAESGLPRRMEDLRVADTAIALCLLLAVWAGYISISAAWLRFLVRGEIHAFPFRLGADEGRLTLSLIVHALILVIVLIGAALSVWAMISLVEFTSGIALPDAAASAVLLAVLAWVSVRLWALPALTIRDRRVWGTDVWPVTRGIFWPALLALLIVAAVTELAPFSSVTKRFDLIGPSDLGAVTALWLSPDAAGMLRWALMIVLALAASIVSYGYSAYIARWDALQVREPVADDALLRMRDVAAS